MHHSPYGRAAGRMLTRKRTIPPEVHALPATELLEQNRLHNAAVLARAYPEEVPAVHQSKGQDRASAVQSLAAVSPFMPEQMLQEFKSLFEESSASEEEADQQVSSSERKSSTVSAQEGIARPLLLQGIPILRTVHQTSLSCCFLKDGKPGEIF